MKESIAAYARAEGLTPKELYQWKTILTRRGLMAGKKASADFVQVMGPPRSSPSASASLVLPNGVRLEKARFKWPLSMPIDVLKLTAQEINWLLDGYPLTITQGNGQLPHHRVL